MTASHTVLLIQPTTRLDSRTYSDFESLTEGLDAILKIFEEFLLKKMNGEREALTYDVNQCFEFLDKLTDISVMVFNRETAQYIPRNRTWIKQQLFEMLRGRCQHPESGEIRIVGY